MAYTLAMAEKHSMGEGWSVSKCFLERCGLPNDDPRPTISLALHFYGHIAGVKQVLRGDDLFRHFQEDPHAVRAIKQRFNLR